MANVNRASFASAFDSVKGKSPTSCITPYGSGCPTQDFCGLFDRVKLFPGTRIDGKNISLHLFQLAREILMMIM